MIRKYNLYVFSTSQSTYQVSYNILFYFTDNVNGVGWKFMFFLSNRSFEFGEVVSSKTVLKKSIYTSFS